MGTAKAKSRVLLGQGPDVDHIITFLRSAGINGVLEECISRNQKVCHSLPQSEKGLGQSPAPLYSPILNEVSSNGISVI